MRSTWLVALVLASTAAAAGAQARTARVVRVVVRDVSGNPLKGARVSLSGPLRREIMTDSQGIAVLTSLPDGAYKVQIESERYTTQTHDLSVRNGKADSLEVALRIGPAGGAPPPPAPARTAPPAAAPARPASPAPIPASSSAAPDAAGVVAVSLPTYLDRNFIGRDPLKESVFSCTPSGIVRVLQLRDPILEHRHADAEEELYVIAGDGSIRAGSEATAVSAGALVVVPRGVPHAIERRGRNPLIVLSTLSGAACHPAAADRSR